MTEVRISDFGYGARLFTFTFAHRSVETATAVTNQVVITLFALAPVQKSVISI